MQKEFSFNTRRVFWDDLQNQIFDIIIVGGGITGAGIALDAASRGLKVLLVEKNDFASGTSSRSTKLVHAGIRYLKNAEFKMVQDVGKERLIIAKNAPHLAKSIEVVLPVFNFSAVKKWQLKIGMLLFEFLVNVPKNEKHKTYDGATLKSKYKQIHQEILGGVSYTERLTDDARLTLSVIKKSIEYQAQCVNYVKVVGFETSHKLIVEDHFTKEKKTIEGKYIINAAGPWVDEIRLLDEASTKTKLIHTKGVHIVVDRTKLPIKEAIYLDTPDKRMFFMVPKRQKIYIGTIDTFYYENLDSPRVGVQDAEYLVNAVNHAFPEAKITVQDIESVWVGLRPLVGENGKAPSQISRKDEVYESSSGMISIAGGKLTGYRLMAKEVTDLVCKKIKLNQTCKTETIVLDGGDFSSLENYKKDLCIKCLDVPCDVVERFVDLFGSHAPKLCQIFEKQHYEDLWLRILASEIQYCIQYEYCMLPSDYLLRRSSNFLFNRKETLLAKDFIYLQWNALMPITIEDFDKDWNHILEETSIV